MRTWSFISQKGGSGKTSICTQIAVHATECGERVLIADLDPQGSAEVWHQKRGIDRHPGAQRCLPEKLGLVQTGAANLNYSLLLVDTAPHTDKDVLTAVRAADLIVCPTQSSLFDLASLEDTATLLDNAGCKSKAVVVVNSIPPGKSEAATFDEAAAVVKTYGLRLCAKYICHRRAFVTSTNEGKGVTESNADKKASDEIKGLWMALSKLSPAVTPRKSEALK